VEVKVLSEGRGGLLGIGGGQARVLVRPARSEDDEEEELDEDEIPSRGFSLSAETDEDEEEDQAPVEDTLPARVPAPHDDATGDAVETLQMLLDMMGLDTQVEARVPQTSGDGAGLVAAVLDVSGEDLGLLIGRRGETLASLQYILNLIIRRRTHSRLTFGIDVEGYRRRREAMLNGLAQRMADRVRATGQSLTLEPMPPAERRIVHIALADDPDVLTISIGEGDARKVAITPRR
jgi:spoIIIJ-associated protein